MARPLPINQPSEAVMNTIVRYHPLRNFRREFDRLFDDFLPVLPTTEEATLWTPPFDFSETDDAFVARMDLPGMNREDIKVELQNRRLTVSGERKQETEEKRENFHRTERTYGSFYRVITLPTDVKEDEIHATFEKGVLTVHIPKAEAIKPRRIEVVPTTTHELVEA